MLSPQIDEYHLGQFIILYEIRTSFYRQTSEHQSHVDQPGVEAGKIAYALMNKKNYDQVRAKLNNTRLTVA